MEDDKKNRIAIYTCITGDYEYPTDGFKKKKGYDYYLFCDKVFPVKSWQMMIPKYSEDTKLSDVKRQRLIKTHPFWVLNDYDIVVWVDANTTIDDKLYRYIERNKNNKITFKIHPERDCIYSELKECVFWGKESVELGQHIFRMYDQEQYPKHNGLYETNIIISHIHEPEVVDLYNAWWVQIYTYSHRDQLSLNYVIWKNKMKNVVTAVRSYDFPPKPHQKIERKHEV